MSDSSVKRSKAGSDTQKSHDEAKASPQHSSGRSELQQQEVEDQLENVHIFLQGVAMAEHQSRSRKDAGPGSFHPRDHSPASSVAVCSDDGELPDLEQAERSTTTDVSERCIPGRDFCYPAIGITRHRASSTAVSSTDGDILIGLPYRYRHRRRDMERSVPPTASAEGWCSGQAVHENSLLDMLGKDALRDGCVEKSDHDPHAVQWTYVSADKNGIDGVMERGPSRSPASSLRRGRRGQRFESGVTRN